MHASDFPAQSPALQATAAALENDGHDEQMEEEYVDEGSGAPATPRSGTLEQPLDRHRADDIDEYGEAPQAVAANVVMSGSVVGAELADSSRQVGVGSQQNTQGVPEVAADSVLAFLVALEKRARACGVQPSEWYEVRNRPLLDVLRFVEALETPSSSGAASSG